MADTSIVNGIIEQIQTNDIAYAIASSAYGECNTTAGEQIKTVAMTGFKLTPGVTIHVKFININTHNSPQLKINTADAKPMVEYSNQSINSINSWHEGAILTLTYDGTNWVRNENINSHTHGNITNDGKINQTNNWVLQNGDGLIVFDANNSNKLERTGIIFDASDETKVLSKKGSWVDLPKVASYNTLGLVKPAFVTSGSATGFGTAGTRTGDVTINTRSDTNDRYYIIEADKDGRLFVNVPWTNINNDYQTTIVFDGTYNASTNKAATVKTVTDKIADLDVNNITGFSTTKTLKTLTETDGKISATFQDIAFPVTSVGGQTGDITLSDLGLANALRFVGTTTTVLSENDTTSPIIINSNNYTPSQGDVVLASGAEYLWNGSRWDLLGDASSFKKVQTAVNTATAETTEATTFVHSVTQNSEGVITVKTRDLDTTGVWSGTATAWTNNRKVYTDLTNASTTTEINGDSSASANAIGIGINGTLGISNGGTGNTTFTQDCIITYTSNSKLESRGLKVTGATDKDVIITPYATNKNLTINANGTGTATFKSTSGAMEISTTTGAMTISTTTGNLIIESTSTGNVELTNTSTGKVTVSANYGSLIFQSGTTSLTLGNNITSGTNGASEGTITLYSTSTAAHIIDGESTTADYTHTFPNKTGYIVIGSTDDIGSDTGPVYLSDGELIECASVVQTADFTLTGVSGAGSATIGSDTTISSNTEVVQISIAHTTASYLNSPISWTITNNRIVLSASVTTGKAVTGKIYFVKNSA